MLDFVGQQDKLRIIHMILYNKSESTFILNEFNV